MSVQYKILEIKYEEFADITGLKPIEEELAKRAIEVQKSSYAPYSNFNVGAAVLLENGEIVTGSNQENAATPSGLCAERVALFAAGAKNPGVPVVALALVGGPNGSICDEPATPCGACRQVMAEYQKISHRPMIIIMIGKNRVLRFNRVDDILPFIFTSMD